MSHYRRNRTPAPFVQPWDRLEVAARMKEQKHRLSKSSIQFGDNTCDWSTTLRPYFSTKPPERKSPPKPAGISYNAQQGLYKNESTVSLGSDKIEYYRANALPNLQDEHPG